MVEAQSGFCEVAVPVPIHRPFTYAIPRQLDGRNLVGCRVIVPFGSRRLTGVVLSTTAKDTDKDIRAILKVVDRDPVLDSHLMRLAHWIADYYSAPIGEVFRAMLPLAGEIRGKTIFSLTDTGREIAQRLTKSTDTASQVLAALQDAPRSSDYLSRKVPGAKDATAALLKRGWIDVEPEHASRDPLRAPAERLRVEFTSRVDDGVKLKKSERELLAYLELHPGDHNLAIVGETLKKAGEAARSLARRGLLKVEPEQMQHSTGFSAPARVLNEYQAEAAAAIESALTEEKFRTFLLYGITGSGKTEVYLRSIEAALRRGKNALLLVPEIALTPAVAGQFFHRFGDQVAILHSAFGNSERAEQWRRIQANRAKVVVGTRSGVFAPVQNLGLLIVDEEHDGSYKQQENPRYHGRDVAVVRAKELGAVVILGSATPSLESRFNAERGKYTLLRLPERIAKRPLPEVATVDMRAEFLETKKQNLFSRQLLAEIERRIKSREQTMLLLNRRGFSSFMLCRSCGERMLCTNCSVVLTHHRRDRRMLCHYCGFAESVPTKCPKCGSEYIQFLGSGSERVEDELHERLPHARIARLDRDTTAGKNSYDHILELFRNGDTDILVGTQMIAKGHDIPNVTLVGIVLADLGLSMPDFRAAERTFQLLTQAAGRAGRGDQPGRVIIQTLAPDHYAVQFAAAHDYEGFYKKELAFRKWLRYPPFAAFANVIVRAEKQETALRMSTELGHLLTPSPKEIRVMGPAEAPVLRVKNEFRYQILLKSQERAPLRRAVSEIRAFAEEQKWNPTSLVIDVDPMSLM